MVVAKITNKDSGIDRDIILNKISVNKSVFYAIKQITGDSENDILSYFYEIGLTLLKDSISKKRLPQRCNRIVKLFYKNSNFQLRLEASTHYFSYSVSIDNRPIHFFISVTIPNDNISVSGDKFGQALLENHLDLGASQAVDADRPREKLYRCLKTETRNDK